MRQKKRGSRLGSRAPKGRVPLIRPRRDRIMGSSILASLSEAGGNDPLPNCPCKNWASLILGRLRMSRMDSQDWRDGLVATIGNNFQATLRSFLAQKVSN